MNVADITSSRAKLRRAREHFQALKTEIEEFGTQPEAKSSILNYRRDGAWYVVSLNPLPRLTMRMALIAGDCLNNTRAALDHLIWQLVIREDKEPQKANCFPLYTEPDEFEKRCIVPASRPRDKRYPLYGIPLDEPAWTIIERAQPYNRPKKEKDELAVLKELTNSDKHHTLLIQRAIINQEVFASRIRWNIGVQPVEELFSPLPMSSEQPTEIARFRFAPNIEIDMNSAMEVEGEIPLRPCVSNKEISLPVKELPQLIGRVNEILDEVAALPRVEETILQTKLFNP